jgi:serine/threonine protein kinase
MNTKVSSSNDINNVVRSVEINNHEDREEDGEGTGRTSVGGVIVYVPQSIGFSQASHQFSTLGPNIVPNMIGKIKKFVILSCRDIEQFKSRQEKIFPQFPVLVLCKCIGTGVDSMVFDCSMLMGDGTERTDLAAKIHCGNAKLSGSDKRNPIGHHPTSALVEHLKTGGFARRGCWKIEEMVSYRLALLLNDLIRGSLSGCCSSTSSTHSVNRFLLECSNFVTKFIGMNENILIFEKAAGLHLNDAVQKIDASKFREKVCHVAISLARALAFLNCMGFIYRDLKPSNIMYDDSTGALKLIDFGLMYDSLRRDAPESGLDNFKFLCALPSYSAAIEQYELLVISENKTNFCTEMSRLCSKIVECSKLAVLRNKGRELTDFERDITEILIEVPKFAGKSAADFAWMGCSDLTMEEKIQIRRAAEKIGRSVKILYKWNGVKISNVSAITIPPVDVYGFGMIIIVIFFSTKGYFAWSNFHTYFDIVKQEHVRISHDDYARNIKSRRDFLDNLTVILMSLNLSLREECRYSNKELRFLCSFIEACTNQCPVKRPTMAQVCDIIASFTLGYEDYDFELAFEAAKRNCPPPAGYISEEAIGVYEIIDAIMDMEITFEVIKEATDCGEASPNPQQPTLPHMSLSSHDLPSTVLFPSPFDMLPSPIQPIDHTSTAKHKIVSTSSTSPRTIGYQAHPKSSTINTLQDPDTIAKFISITPTSPISSAASAAQHGRSAQVDPKDHHIKRHGLQSSSAMTDSEIGDEVISTQNFDPSVANYATPPMASRYIELSNNAPRNKGVVRQFNWNAGRGMQIRNFSQNMDHGTSIRNFSPDVDHGTSIRNFSPDVDHGTSIRNFSQNVDHGTSIRNFSQNVNHGTSIRNFSQNVNHGTSIRNFSQNVNHEITIQNFGPSTSNNVAFHDDTPVPTKRPRSSFEEIVNNTNPPTLQFSVFDAEENSCATHLVSVNAEQVSSSHSTKFAFAAGIKSPPRTNGNSTEDGPIGGDSTLPDDE